jgi:hypothetical protein
MNPFFSYSVSYVRIMANLEINMYESFCFSYSIGSAEDHGLHKCFGNFSLQHFIAEKCSTKVIHEIKS